jgi:hypothetical protein
LVGCKFSPEEFVAFIAFMTRKVCVASSSKAITSFRFGAGDDNHSRVDWGLNQVYTLTVFSNSLPPILRRVFVLSEESWTGLNLSSLLSI